MSSPHPSDASKKQSRVSESSFTTILLPISLVEGRLARILPEGMSWRRTGDEERQVYVLEGGGAKSRKGVVETLSKDFGSLVVRPGDWDPLAEIIKDFRSAGLSLSAAESCTGGLVAKLITDVAGSSDVFWGSVVSYANSAKVRLLGVPQEVITRHGAVSRETVRAMTEGLLDLSGTDTALSVSGVAGPGGGSPEKPVGTVWLGVGSRTQGFTERLFLFSGSRRRIRILAAYMGLFMLRTFVLRGESIDTGGFDEYI